MTIPPIRVNESRLVVAEGKDEQDLFYHFMSNMQVTGVQVLQVEGKANIRPQLAALTNTPGFEKVTSLAVVRDADADWKAAFDSVQGALRAASLPAPDEPLVIAPGHPSVVILVLPRTGAIGDLERVCLDSVAGDPAVPCVADYLRCLQGAGLDLAKDSNKRELLAFLASRPQVHGSVGRAALGNVWPYESEAFRPIRRLIELVTA